MPPLEKLISYRISFHITEAYGAEGGSEEVSRDFDPVPPDQQKEIAEASERLSKIGEGAALAATSGSDLSGGTEGAASPVSFKVDDFTGAGHASYPIAVPPGRDGFQPKIELVYTSTGGNSWLGVGWDLTLGHIQRRGYRHGVPKYDETDILELQLPGSGPQELVKVTSGPYLGEYRLKVEGSLLRIRYVQGSNSWEVTDKSGVKMKFGQSAASRIGRNPASQSSTGVFRWCLDRVEDPKTNYLQVSYQKPPDSPGAIYLKEIHYNGQISGGLSHNHHVYFNLEGTARPDPIYNYRGGFKQLIMRRLSSIEVKTNQVQGEALVRRYELSYVQNSQDIHADPQPRSRLAQIKLYGSDYGSPNPVDLPAVKFTYQTPNRGFEGNPITWQNPSVWGATKGNLIQNFGVGGGGTQTDVIDLNGDGRVDRVVYDHWTSQYRTWGVYFNNGEGFDSLPGGDQPNWPNPSAWDDKKGNYIRNTYMDSENRNLGTFTDVIDMNGDGLPDRVVYNRDCQSQYPNCPWTVYWNTGNPEQGFAEQSAPNWPNPSVWDREDNKGNYIRSNRWVGTYNYGTMTEVIDMNGDGLPDRVVYDKDYVYQAGRPANWKVYWNIYKDDDPLQTGFSQTAYTWVNYSPWVNNNHGNTIRSVRLDGSGTIADLIDMNGDGLPDRVVYDYNYNYNGNNFQPAMWRVYFNTGSGFETTPVLWPNPSPWGNANGNNIRDTGVYGIHTDVVDVNGDGLPDRVVKDLTSPYDTWEVYFNYGAGFGPAVVLPGSPRPGGWAWSKPHPEGWGGQHDGNLISEHYFDGEFVYGTKAALFDINGDGLPDRVYFKKNCKQEKDESWNCPWTVYLNKGPVTDLLSKIENGLGGTIEITYQASTAYEDNQGQKTNHIPLVVQTVYTYTMTDGRGEGNEHRYERRYHYANGDYDGKKGDFLGFGKVTSYQMRGEQEWESKTETEFHQRVDSGSDEGEVDEYRKGKPKWQKVTSWEGHTKETVYSWNPGYPTLGGGKFPGLDSVTTTVTDVGFGGPWTYSQTTRDVYDIRSGDLEHQTLNLLEEHKNEVCPTCDSADEVQTVMEYGALNWVNWILDKPTVVTVTKYVKREPPEQDIPHQVQSRKWMDYDSEGKLIMEEVCKSDHPDTGCENRNSTIDPQDGPNPVTLYTYDPLYKVLVSVKDPRKYLTTITYDSTKTHVYETTKCADLGCTSQHKTTTEYDPGTGNLIKLVPPHLQGTEFWLQTKYDALGRKTLERMKDNPDPNAAPNVDRGSTSYAYNNFGNAQSQHILRTGRIVIEGMPEGSTLTFHGYTYFDGMGRTYLAMADGPEGKRICTQTLFDGVGRVWKQSNPHFCDDLGTPLETPHYTVTSYDGLSRVTEVEKPQRPPSRPNGPGYRIQTVYEGLTKRVKKEYGDDQWQVTTYTYDRNQKLVRVGEGIGVAGQETYTHYRYDVLGNLVEVLAAKDATGETDLLGALISTSMSYDSLMKKTGMVDPDMGSWTYRYDKFGNLILQVDAKSQAIAFEYDGLNRMTRKHYCETYSLDPPGCTTIRHSIEYNYDASEVPYSKGKLTGILDAEGQNYDYVLEYDLFQRVKRSQKYIGADSATFEKGYDSAGRVVSIKYLVGPEGERIEKIYDYVYDVAGNLLSVQERGAAYPLVVYSDFTALGQPGVALYPKSPTVSVRTSYTYYPETGRLETLVTEKVVNGQVEEIYQALDYQDYDGVGNILVLDDVVNGITHHYEYDHLNRLIQAYGVGSNPYTQSYQYDLIGNIVYKSDVGNYRYNYATRPHGMNSTEGVISITNIEYDANGNMTERTEGGVTRVFEWDSDNKPISVREGEQTLVTFSYDGNGFRVKKVGPSGTVLYFGELYEERPEGGILYVFAKNKRLAQVELNGITKFYHGNHLGSSCVITDDSGKKLQRMDYYPFGTFFVVDPPGPIVPYRFTGQEEDDELGLYNYGARLYDPALGKFLSPDSIVQAPDDPQTLNRYSYARNNPIIYTDPSGNFFLIDDIIGALILLGELILSSEIATAVVGGAILGAGLSAITGENIALGALTGAISGVLFFGAGEVLPTITKALGVTTKLGEMAVTAGVHAVTGAVSGGINAAITGSDIGLGMLTGAVAAGIGSATGAILPNKFGYQLVGQVVAGAIAGGIVSELYGGNFWEGFARGAYTAAIGFLFNQAVHAVRSRTNRIVEGEASFYNKSVTGKTANEEVFDKNAMAGAMHDVPFGTKVTVQYIGENGRVMNSLEVRINDRGPWGVDAQGRVKIPLEPHPTRVVDLTEGAFKALVGSTRLGVIHVRVIIP